MLWFNFILGLKLKYRVTYSCMYVQMAWICDQVEETG